MFRVTFSSAFFFAFCLTAGSFIYQAMQSVPSWETAAERGFFQSVAIFIVWSAWRNPNKESKS